MAIILNLLLRCSSKKIARLIPKIQNIQNSQVTAKTSSYQRASAFYSWNYCFSTIRRHFQFKEDLTYHHHRSIRHFQSSAILCTESKIVLAPEFPESITEGDVKWAKNVGEAVAEDDVVLDIETDKTVMPVYATVPGIIEEQYVQDGAAVKTGQQLFRLKVTGVATGKPLPTAAAPTPQAAAPPPQAQPPAAPQPASARPPAAPPGAARAPAVPRPAAVPSAPLSVSAQQARAATIKIPPADPTKEISGTRSEHHVKMNRMRQRIAQRLKEAQNTSAMLTTFNEVDMSNIIQFRKQQMETFQKKYKVKLGFMSTFVKASAYALQEFPIVNASIDGVNIVYRDYIDISIAVASPKGLVVPVLRNVQEMNYADIELAIITFSEKARKGTLAIEDMDGGSFTISNGGVFGSLMGTPIINPPQSAILGMHATFERPVALKGNVVIRPMMYIALTYDHRLIDGREAVLFLRKIKYGVEDPRIMYLGL